MAGNAPYSDYELISTTVLGSTTSSITFSSLGTYSSTYKHLQIRAAIRTVRGASGDIFGFRFNGDTASNYGLHNLSATGAAVESTGDTPLNAIYLSYNLSSSDPANQYTAAVVDLLDSFSTTKNKTTRLFFGNGSAPVTSAGQRHLGLESGLWRNTASITSIEMLPILGTGIASGSRFSLYGIKG